MLNKKGCFFSALITSVFYISNPFGVKGKVLGINTRKILRPDPGQSTHYYLSYVIFCGSNVFKSHAKTGRKLDAFGCLKICVSQKMS